MKNKFFTPFFCVLSLGVAGALSACSDDNDSPEASVELVNVSISSDADNTLRYPVAVTASADCEVSISYWPVKEPAKERTTKAVATAGTVAELKIMFVKPETDYKFVVNLNGHRGEQEFDFSTIALPSDIPTYTVTADNGGAPESGYILQWQATKPGYITFCDMDGIVVWYERIEQAPRVVTYDNERRKMCVMMGFATLDNNKSNRFADNSFIMDLEGKRECEWHINECDLKLAHHEIRYLPNGNLIFVRNYIKEFDLTPIGLEANTEVWGDGFVEMDLNGNVVSEWDIFDEYSPLNGNGEINEKGALKDFAHANSVNYDSEGYYYMTFNRLKQLWKIDPRTGKVLYRVGVNGNVALPEEYMPEGLHAPEIIAANKVLVLDNGEERGFSRSMIFEIDPATMTCKVPVCINYPVQYSSIDRSNAQPIDDCKSIMFSSTLGRACLFTDTQGNIQKIISRTGISYRGLYYSEVLE